MNKPYAIIFFGFLAVLMGIGKDKTELIPSELKLTIGLLLIGYGIYLTYKPTTENTKTKTLTKKQAKKGRSYIYLAIGVLLLKSPRFFDPNNPYSMSFTKILIWVFGFGFVIYGLTLFFKEKRDKQESGSIE
jgi:putative Mn2+ efflux pump MntP